MGLTVLFLNDTHNVPGGAEYQVSELAKAARAAGMGALVGCIPGSQTERYFRGAGVETVPVPELRKKLKSAEAAIKRTCREHSVDIIHTASFLTNFSGRKAGKALGLPVVTTVHCEPDSILLAEPGLRSRLTFRVRSLFDRTDETTAFIAVSRAVADKLASNGVSRARITVIHNGIDAGAVSDKAANGGATIVKGADDELLVGTMARLDPVKGLDVLIRAAAILVQRGLKVKTVIIGEGERRPALETLAGELGLEGRVVFTGFLDNHYAQVKALDLYAVPSLSEGQNVTVLLAMALGVPVVATAVGGIVDMVADGVSGLLVSPRDPGALADALEKASRDASLRGRLRAGAAAVLPNFTVEAMCAKTLALYRNLRPVS